MIRGPIMNSVRDELKKFWFYEVAEQEMQNCIHPSLIKQESMIHIEDVKALMILAWLRGNSYSREQK